MLDSRSEKLTDDGLLLLDQNENLKKPTMIPKKELMC